MSMKLYVGNLDYQISDNGLGQLFAQAGTIESARVVTTIAGNPRGFGFVEMSSREEGAAAIAQLNGREINGRRLIVNEEEPPMTRAAGANFGGNGSRKENSYAASRAIRWYQDRRRASRHAYSGLHMSVQGQILVNLL